MDVVLVVTGVSGINSAMGITFQRAVQTERPRHTLLCTSQNVFDRRARCGGLVSSWVLTLNPALPRILFALIRPGTCINLFRRQASFLELALRPFFILIM